MSSRWSIRFATVAVLFGLGSTATFSCMLLAQERQGFGREEPDGEFREVPVRVDDLKLKAEHGFEAMCDSLALDKPQKRQARRLFDDMLDKKRELIRILQNGYLDIDLLCEKVTRINRDYFERLSGLLNEQQKQKFIRLRETWLEPCR